MVVYISQHNDIYDVEMKIRILWVCLCVFIDVLATIACLMVVLFYIKTPG